MHLLQNHCSKLHLFRVSRFEVLNYPSVNYIGNYIYNSVENFGLKQTKKLTKNLFAKSIQVMGGLSPNLFCYSKHKEYIGVNCKGTPYLEARVLEEGLIENSRIETRHQTPFDFSFGAPKSFVLCFSQTLVLNFLLHTLQLSLICLLPLFLKPKTCVLFVNTIE